MNTKERLCTKIALSIFFLLVLCRTAGAQDSQKATLTAADGGTCSATSTACLVINIPSGSGGATFNIGANASANTVQFEATADYGVTWVALSVTPSSSTTTVTSTTSTGAWQANVAGYTKVRMRCSTFVGGTTTTYINLSTASARSNGGGGSVTHTAGNLTAFHLMLGNGLADSTVDSACVTNGTGALSGCTSISAGSGASAAGATATGGFACVEAASTGWTPTVGQDYKRCDSALHTLVCSFNGGAEVPCAPNVPGVTGPPTSGLMARYDIPATDSAAALTDTSGNGRNGTGTEGVAPTIAASTGGLVCGGAGSAQLPASLNTALTIAVYLTLNPPAPSGYSAPFLGNGNLTANNAIGLLLNDAVADHPFVQTFGNNNFRSKTGQGFLGTGLLILSLDTTDRVFFGTQEGGYSGTGTSAGLQTAGFYQLCGNAGGSGSGGNTRMTGNIYNAYFYDHVLSALERAQLNQWLTNFNTARGVPPTLVSTLSGSQAVFLGDSITAGSLSSFSMTSAMTLNGTWTIRNNGMSGVAVFNKVANPQYSAEILFVPSAQNNVMHIWLGTNDVCLQGRTAAQAIQDLSSFARGRRAAGWKVIVATMLSRTGCDAIKNTLNATIRTNWNQFADGLSDMAADTFMGADGDSANTTYFSVDGIHPNQNAIYNGQTPIAQRAINRLYGNRDFSTATTYAAAAAAAVATTAGSEATNTVTLTFAATPANCLVGNTILVAGTTPAGYSKATGWTILTRSATQVTYWADTASMGVITVQGTGVCSQQQDADMYEILNFGAGNHTLESCVGYTGQNIYIKNINAGGSTVVPFSAELIDGAANVTIAAKATLVLQSILTSAAAGGCSWKQLQNN